MTDRRPLIAHVIYRLSTGGLENGLPAGRIVDLEIGQYDWPRRYPPLDGNPDSIVAGIYI